MRRVRYLLMLLAIAACDDPASAPVPTQLTVAGGGQTGAAGAALPQPLVARVTDEDGDPIRGVTVRWTVSAGTVTPDSVRTDEQGEARAVWTLGGAVGAQTATATVTGLNPASLTATAGPAAAAQVVARPDSLAFSLPGDTATVRVTAADRFGNAVGVAFTSLDPAVASVTAEGVVRATGNGTTRIVITSGAVADTVPVRVRIAAFASVSAGINHSCGVTAEGEAFCWGSGAFGILGNGDTSDRYAPTRVAGPVRWAAVSAGFQHTCGLSTDGELYCWGYNDVGQLGTGEEGGSRNEPTRAATDVRFTRVSVGGKHSCAIATTRRMYCWGTDAAGQLGNGMSAGRATAPTLTAEELVFREVSAGSEHTCAVTTLQRVNCWGANPSGQLGDSTRAQRQSPVPTDERSYATVSAGASHSCAITTEGGAFCWGSNNQGQLGTGSTLDVDRPTAVADGRRYSRISAGSDHSCGVDVDGVALCWGRNANGQLGTGTSADSRTPAPVAAPASFRGVSAGARHSCGVLASGAVMCWGLNSSGQLGTGTDSPSNVPVRTAAPR
ncbi:MAG TPA: Ig-like domain-containing protein [Longimicrobium sp.]